MSASTRVRSVVLSILLLSMGGIGACSEPRNTLLDGGAGTGGNTGGLDGGGSDGAGGTTATAGNDGGGGGSGGSSADAPIDQPIALDGNGPSPSDAEAPDAPGTDTKTCNCAPRTGQTATCNASDECVYTCSAAASRLCKETCIASTACCADTDCAPQNGKVGKCDSSTGMCSYSCSEGMKPCGATCIASAGCCADMDCAGGFACAANACSTTTCAAGFKKCGTKCIPMAGCCADADCPNNFACTNNACSTTACKTGFKLCPGTAACVATAACCDNSGCGNCQKCVSGACQNQTATEDLKNYCADGTCRTGFCNGQGACGFTAAGQKGPNCMTGNGNCDQCNGAGVCQNTQSICYPDVDGDGQGNQYAAAPTLVCGACGAGFVEDNHTDCDDRDANVRQGAAFQTTARANGSWDYNCSGKTEFSKNFVGSCMEVRNGAGVVTGCTAMETPPGSDSLCGKSGEEYNIICEFGGGACYNTSPGPVTISCR